MSLDNLIIKGTLRVFLHPFTTEPPYFFESASVMFIAPPTISYSIAVTAGMRLAAGSRLLGV